MGQGERSRVSRAAGRGERAGTEVADGSWRGAGRAPPPGGTYVNLRTIKAVLIHDPGSKRTREWWERWRGDRLRRLRREGAGCQPCPWDWHFNKRLLQCPVWYNNRVTPLPSAFSHRPRALGPPCLHPPPAVPPVDRALGPRDKVQLGSEGPANLQGQPGPHCKHPLGPQVTPTCQ